MTRLIKPLLVLSLFACGPSTREASTLDPLPNPMEPGFTASQQPTATKYAALVTFGGGAACADLEKHLEDRAVLDMRLRVASSKKYALQWWDSSHQPNGTGGGTGGGTGTFDSGSAGGAGGSSGGAGGGGGGAGSGPTDYTTTNNQVVGVDEADFVKNDGTRLFVLSGRSLFTASTWPASALARRGQVALDGRPAAMFLEGDRVVVFSYGFVPGFDLPSWCRQGGCGDWYSNATIVSYVDVSDLSTPRVVARQQLAGRYFDARRVGNSMRVVTQHAFPWLNELTTWVDWNVQQSAVSKQALSDAFDALANSNEVRIRQRSLSQWLPDALLLTAAGNSALPFNCADVVSTTASARLGVTNVVTLDLADPTQVKRQAMLAQVDELYQSHDALYLSQRHWWWWWFDGQDDVTYVYKFDTTQPDRARFAASARIDGTPLNQFAFDEHRGYLRVATTAWEPVSAGSGGGTGAQVSVNRVVVLDEQGGSLVEVGRTEDLAPGERIMSARFVGDTAYVVTFRQVDPLYTIDLSDPARPRKVGELKIPGFSSYIHPLDATHLLTIGTYTPEVQTDWRERHLQLQIFDVADLAHPRQTHTQFVGRAWGWSEAQWEHKAFNYFPARGLLAIPFSDYFSDAAGWHYASDLRVFHVDAQAGFQAKGSLDMTDVLYRDTACGYGCWSWYWSPQVRRSVMADDYVYAVSSGGVRVAQVDDLGHPLATALFDPSP
ncbi:MAG: beta-propeller domain-containing protein [Myxococcales bacterium]|nr:beta-propeller domain-containing protein [Myxococcales bacterium]